MLENYLRLATRILWKNKGHTLICISGLAIGISCCLLIVLFVSHELSFDRFHSKSDRLYRAWFKSDTGNGNTLLQTTTPFPLRTVFLENVAEIEASTRIIPISPWVKVGDTRYAEQVTFVGKDFFNLFDFPTSEGSQVASVIGSSEAILSSSTAAKYFGRSAAEHQIIAIQIGEKFYDFTVKEVVADPPSNSSIRFTILISDENLDKLYDKQLLESDWQRGFPETYVLLRRDADAASVAAKFPALFKNILPQLNSYEVGLQPLADIHLNRKFPISFTPIGDVRQIYILSGIALLMLLMACINFVTLSVGMSLTRSKEVGLRKVIGAGKKQIIAQFIGETLIITFISLITGYGISTMALPLFNELSGKQLVLAPGPIVILAGIIILIFIGVVAGSYPAFILSGLKPLAVLQQTTQSVGKQRIRRILVSVQLVLSIFLVSSTLIMRQQLHYVQNKDIGFTKEHLVSVNLNIARSGNLVDVISQGFDKAEQFRTELSKYPNMEVSCATHLFGEGQWTSIAFTDQTGELQRFYLNVVDEMFIPSIRASLAAGRNFTDSPDDALHAVIVNEAFVKSYGLENPIGMRIPGDRFADHEIIGVVRDFNYASLYEKVEPLVLTMNPFIPLSGMESISIHSSPIPKLLVRITSENNEATIDKIRSAWDKLSDNEEFSFQFVQEKLNAQYRQDQNLGKVVNVVSILALLIGGLGLYALATLSMQSRVKEVSIRKVMGASERYLMYLLTRGYLYLIGMCILMSIPVTYIVMNRWLESFEYRITPGWQVFASISLLSIFLGMAAISYQTIVLIRTNPARSLKAD